MKLNSKVNHMELKEFVKEGSIEENFLQRNKYQISQKADKMIFKLKRRRDKILSDDNVKDEEKKIARAIDRALPIMERFKKYFIRLESELDSTDDEERRKLIESKYDDIKVLFINELYKIMESVSYRSSVMIAGLIAWIILILATPFTNWMLIPTFINLKNLNKNKKKVTSRQFSRELNKITEKLESKKRLQYRSYANKDIGVEF